MLEASARIVTGKMEIVGLRPNHSLRIHPKIAERQMNPRYRYHGRTEGNAARSANAACVTRGCHDASMRGVVYTARSCRRRRATCSTPMPAPDRARAGARAPSPGSSPFLFHPAPASFTCRTPSSGIWQRPAAEKPRPNRHLFLAKRNVEGMTALGKTAFWCVCVFAHLTAPYWLLAYQMLRKPSSFGPRERQFFVLSSISAHDGPAAKWSERGVLSLIGRLAVRPVLRPSWSSASRTTRIICSQISC
ncbi:hypothetical protein IE81DRAFT_204466 [Ceraceosorus guamensis]|uniref:Uncharacterized protein n=1 Tax=Ceraceosorus guamensis TaxID=1522189 RepID=A0A316VT30_9BASI|nr:hypothetical protein IE81DRAFT_204466 [Ceraceosorus guamensis]PWN40746.1 hypothetical protein IE81DRAFT_204466 [Ceraceosorus guamensis]